MKSDEDSFRLVIFPGIILTEDSVIIEKDNQLSKKIEAGVWNHIALTSNQSTRQVDCFINYTKEITFDLQAFTSAPTKVLRASECSLSVTELRFWKVSPMVSKQLKSVS